MLKLEERRKYENYNLETREDYFKLYEKLIGTNLHEPFPHKPFYFRWYRNEDVGDPRDIFNGTYHDNFFPFKEELGLEDLKEGSNYCNGYGDIYKSDCEEKGSDILRSLDVFSLHYSHDPKVWEWDWERTVEENNMNKQIDLYFWSANNSEDSLWKASKIFTKNQIQNKLLKREGELRVRVNKRNYFRFRKSLLELSSNYKIYSEYDYNEIRKAIRDWPITIIA